jgi:hypothetical protein
MELPGVGPGGKFGDKVELAEEFAHHLAGIITLTEIFELAHEACQRVLGLTNRHVGVVLALAFETRVMLLELATIEIGEATARATVKWDLIREDWKRRETVLDGHPGGTHPV